ncbi:MAG TPA: NAD-dependent epimerase/dehydratase family protein [Candidatus Acidoferrum sp.]|nr:NAD-dependent epimerase/dehydratase family protein [Candidatus Acidoferrum sp.]
MSRILIAGCGYVGTATGALFHAAGWEVEGWTASAPSARELPTRPFPVRPVDLTDQKAVTAAVAPFDVVVHCASSRGGSTDAYRGIYLEGARHLRTTFPAARLLFTSSTSVYGQRDGEWVTERSPAQPERPTADLLREAEELVLQGGGVVVRLAGIYGPGRSAMLRKFLAGTATIDPGPERWINQVHRDDIADALYLLAQRAPDGGGPNERIFNVTDNHPLTQRACYEWLAARLQRPIPPVAAAASERRRGNSNKRVSSARLLSLGWSPRYPTFQSAMADSILPDWPFDPVW